MSYPVQILTPVAFTLNLVYVRQHSEGISTMSTPGVVRCLPMEGVVEMTTGLTLLKNVTEYAVQVRVLTSPTSFEMDFSCRY